MLQTESKMVFLFPTLLKKCEDFFSSKGSYSLFTPSLRKHEKFAKSEDIEILLVIEVFIVGHVVFYKFVTSPYFFAVAQSSTVVVHVAQCTLSEHFPTLV